MYRAGAPRITLALMAYNQMRWIGRALESALAQRFDGLEIIVNDDASSDGTAQIIRDMARRYTGPHGLRLNFNETNIGLVPSLNRAFRLASAPFVVVAAGDDISLPNRVETIAGIVAQPGEPVMAVVSDAIAVDQAGRRLGYIDNRAASAALSAAGFAERGGYINGAAAGYSRRLVEVFGDIDPRARAEDSVLPFRAALLGRVVHIPHPLILRRIHAGSMSGGDPGREYWLRNMRPALYALRSRARDAGHPDVVMLRGADEVAALRQAIARSAVWQDAMIGLLERRLGAVACAIGVVLKQGRPPLPAAKTILTLRWPGLWKLNRHIRGLIRQALRIGRRPARGGDVAAAVGSGRRN